MSNNPFRPGTTQYHDFEVMSDLQWHCTKCELKSGQAKTWQVWKQERGIQLDTDEKGHDYKRMMCPTCGHVTFHRKLKTTEINKENIKPRSKLPKQLEDRIKNLYGCVDEYSLRTEAPGKLEIDHRVPQVRWTDGESKNNVDMSDEEIRGKFMLLTRENNLLKSRVCEDCKKTGLRGCGYKMIEYWYKGDKNYDPEIGCDGCFWHNPNEWRKRLNDYLLQIEKEQWEKNK